MDGVRGRRALGSRSGGVVSRTAPSYVVPWVASLPFGRCGQLRGGTALSTVERVGGALRAGVEGFVGALAPVRVRPSTSGPYLGRGCGLYVVNGDAARADGRYHFGRVHGVVAPQCALGFGTAPRYRSEG